MLTLAQYNTEKAASTSVLDTFHSLPLSSDAWWLGPSEKWCNFSDGPSPGNGVDSFSAGLCLAVPTKRVVTYSGQQHNALIDLCSRRRECGMGHSDHPQFTLCHKQHTENSSSMHLPSKVSNHHPTYSQQHLYSSGWLGNDH